MIVMNNTDDILGNPNEILKNADEIIGDRKNVADPADIVLPEAKPIIARVLNKVNVLFMGPVEDGYFKPVPDKLNTPPRWESGTYSLAEGKWTASSTTAHLMDLSPYNGYSILVIASEWNKEVISDARLFGVLDTVAGDVIHKFGYQHLQEKEEEIARYISGIGN